MVEARNNNTNKSFEASFEISDSDDQDSKLAQNQVAEETKQAQKTQTESR